MSKSKTIFVLLITGCAGPQFVFDPPGTTTESSPDIPESGVQPLEGAVPAAEASIDSRTDHDSFEAAASIDGAIDGGARFVDAASQVDSSADAFIDAFPEANVDAGPPPTCYPVLTSVSAVCGNYAVDPPGSYCQLWATTSYAGGMPRQCQCAGTADCSCLLASVSSPDLLCTGGAFVSCSTEMHTHLVTVTCK